jgi:hypothetical protein
MPLNQPGQALNGCADRIFAPTNFNFIITARLPVERNDDSRQFLQGT